MLADAVFYCLKCLVAYIMLDLAGVLRGGFFADAQVYKQLRQQLMPLVYLVGYLASRFGQEKMSAFIEGHEAAAFQYAHSAADARF